jgi:hypothetical protein
LCCERPNYCGAPVIWIIDFPRGGGKRFENMRIVPVKARDTVKMIGKIDEQPRGARQIGVSDTGWFHVFWTR